MIRLFKILALILFDIIDHFYHQLRIKNYLKKKKFKILNLIDVGAHLGTYTAMFMSLYEKANFYAFEPQEHIYLKLKKKFKKNKNVFVYNLALSNTESIKNFKINMHDLTSTFSNFNKSSKYLNFKAKLFNSTIESMNYKTKKIKTIVLKKFINSNKIKSVDFLKIDTEGHDLEVLKGLGNKIEITKNILIEFHHRNIFQNYDSRDIHNYLIKKKFKLVKIFRFPFSFEDRLYSKNNNIIN